MRNIVISIVLVLGGWMGSDADAQDVRSTKSVRNHGVDSKELPSFSSERSRSVTVIILDCYPATLPRGYKSTSSTVLPERTPVMPRGFTKTQTRVVAKPLRSFGVVRGKSVTVRVVK